MEGIIAFDRDITHICVVRNKLMHTFFLYLHNLRIKWDLHTQFSFHCYENYVKCGLQLAYLDISCVHNVPLQLFMMTVTCCLWITLLFWISFLVDTDVLYNSLKIWKAFSASIMLTTIIRKFISYFKLLKAIKSFFSFNESCFGCCCFLKSQLNFGTLIIVHPQHES